MLTFYTPPENLTAKQYEFVKSAMHYQILPDGAFLLSIPAPHGYLYWNNKEKDFEVQVKKMLSELNIQNVAQ